MTNLEIAKLIKNETGYVVFIDEDDIDVILGWDYTDKVFIKAYNEIEKLLNQCTTKLTVDDISFCAESTGRRV